MRTVNAAIFNPKDKSVEELPFIYGFNNGGGGGLYHGVLIAQDGTCLGGHGCSHEGYMLGDLGILEGSRPDRHESFREHYPDGYRMAFVGYKDVNAHEGLQAAFKLNQANKKEMQPTNEVGAVASETSA